MVSDIVVDQAEGEDLKAKTSFLIKFYQSVEADESSGTSPSVLGELVGEGYDVGGTATAVAHHHRDGRLIPQALQGDGDNVGTSLHDQTHKRNPLTQT